MFRITLLKLGIACVILAVNHFLMPPLFSQLMLDIIFISGRQGDVEFIYNLSWFMNELSCYLLPMIAIGAVFFSDLFGEKRVRIAHTPRYKGWHGVAYYGAMTTAGFVASTIASRILRIFTDVFGTEEIKDVISEVAPESTGGLWGYLICTCFIAPVCEELLFRFALLKPLRRCGDWFSVIVSAVLFSLFHGNLDQAPYALAVGVILGIIAVKSGSVLPSIILHSVNNILVSAVNYLPDANELLSVISQIASTICTAVVFFGFGGLAWLVYELNKEPLVRTPEEIRGKTMARLIFTSPAFYIGVVACIALFYH